MIRSTSLKAGVRAATPRGTNISPTSSEVSTKKPTASLGAKGVPGVKAAPVRARPTSAKPVARAKVGGAEVTALQVETLEQHSIHTPRESVERLYQEGQEREMRLEKKRQDSELKLWEEVEANTAEHKKLKEQNARSAARHFPAPPREAKSPSKEPRAVTAKVSPRATVSHPKQSAATRPKEPHAAPTAKASPRPSKPSVQLTIPREPAVARPKEAHTASAPRLSSDEIALRKMEAERVAVQKIKEANARRMARATTAAAKQDPEGAASKETEGAATVKGFNRKVGMAKVPASAPRTPTPSRSRVVAA